MNNTGRYRELSMTQAELDMLPAYTPELRYGDPEGLYRDQSTAVGHAPMAVKFVDDPLSDYPREVWFHLEIRK